VSNVSDAPLGMLVKDPTVQGMFVKDPTLCSAQQMSYVCIEYA
jgi:hypothetical protein